MEIGCLSTQPHLPPSLPSSLCPYLPPSVFPLCFFPSLTCLGSQSRDSLIHFFPLSQKYVFRSRFLSYNDGVQFLCLLLLLRIIGVHRFPTSNPTVQTAFPGCWDSAGPETAVNHPISQALRSYLKLPQGLFPQYSAAVPLYFLHSFTIIRALVRSSHSL